uniref:RQCD1 n=1 Tax=Arundo donax TaxID=35708 RepID=A0A0A9EFX4_ARUDO
MQQSEEVRVHCRLGLMCLLIMLGGKVQGRLTQFHGAVQQLCQKSATAVEPNPYMSPFSRMEPPWKRPSPGARGKGINASRLLLPAPLPVEPLDAAASLVPPYRVTCAHRKTNPPAAATPAAGLDGGVPPQPNLRRVGSAGPRARAECSPHCSAAAVRVPRDAVLRRLSSAKRPPGAA